MDPINFASDPIRETIFLYDCNSGGAPVAWNCVREEMKSH